MSPWRPLAWLLAAALCASPARADRCARADLGALSLAPGPASLGVTPSPCASRALGVAVRAAARIDREDYYGAVVGEALLTGALPLGGRLWLTASLAAAQYRRVQNTVLVAEDVGLGGADVALHASLWSSERVDVAAWVRAALPAETGGLYALRGGAEVGASAHWRPTARLWVLAGVSVPTLVSAAGARVTTTVTPRASVDVGLRALRWLEPALGVELRLGFDRAGALEQLAPRASLRLHLGARVSVFAAAAAPAAGLERSGFAASLGVRVDDAGGGR